MIESQVKKYKGSRKIKSGHELGEESKWLV